MAWPLKYHSTKPETVQIGDVWPADEEHHSEERLSDQYRRDWQGKRPPLFVCLPAFYENGFRSSQWFLMDRASSRSLSKKKTSGWDVIIEGVLVNGEQPNITVRPSINCVGSYHGYIKQGVIGDDVENRK